MEPRGYVAGEGRLRTSRTLNVIRITTAWALRGQIGVTTTALTRTAGGTNGEANWSKSPQICELMQNPVDVKKIMKNL